MPRQRFALAVLAGVVASALAGGGDHVVKVNKMRYSTDDGVVSSAEMGWREHDVDRKDADHDSTSARDGCGAQRLKGAAAHAPEDKVHRRDGDGKLTAPSMPLAAPMFEDGADGDGRLTVRRCGLSRDVEGALSNDANGHARSNRCAPAADLSRRAKLQEYASWSRTELGITSGPMRPGSGHESDDRHPGYGGRHACGRLRSAARLPVRGGRAARPAHGVNRPGQRSRRRGRAKGRQSLRVS